jgi:hypothetical protein
MDVCRTERPPEATVGDDVRVACHLYAAGTAEDPVAVPPAEAIA